MIIKKIKKNYDKQAFTLVELIVVITILTILWTISFISLQWYSRDARDATRISDMSNIKKALELTYLKVWKYPNTTNGHIITFSWTKVWTQWLFWEETFKKVKRLNKIPKDPLTWLEYTYSVTSTNQEYQVAWIMEWNILSMDNILLWEILAWNDEWYLRILWKYNWKIISTKAWDTTYVLWVPSLITSTWATLEEIIQWNYFAYNWFKNLPFQYEDSQYNIRWDSWKIFVNNSNNSILFKWNLNDLYKKENIDWRLDLITNLQNTYSWTSIANIDWIEKITTLDLTDSTAVNLLSSTIINNTLGWNIIIDINDNLDWEIVNNIDPTSLCTTWWEILSSSTVYGSCDWPDIVMCSWAWTWYVLAWCNVWTNISGTWSASYWSYYNYPNFSGSSDTLCWDWYHVPTDNEWNWVMSYWIWNPTWMRDDLKLPIAWYQLLSPTALWDNYGYYWGYVNLWSYVMHMRRAENVIKTVIGFYGPGTNWEYEFTVRCFKDN